MRRRLQVLVVEDDPALREVYEQILTAEGHHVRLAVDGLEGMKALSDDLDIIIADLNMPRMSGAEFLEAIRTSPQFGRLPVLVISGRPHTLPEFLQGPLTSVLRKPFRLDMLNRFVETLAARTALH